MAGGALAEAGARMAFSGVPEAHAEPAPWPEAAAAAARCSASRAIWASRALRSFSSWAWICCKESGAACCPPHAACCAAACLAACAAKEPPALACACAYSCCCSAMMRASSSCRFLSLAALAVAPLALALALGFLDIECSSSPPSREASAPASAAFWPASCARRASAPDDSIPTSAPSACRVLAIAGLRPTARRARCPERRSTRRGRGRADPGRAVAASLLLLLLLLLLLRLLLRLLRLRRLRRAGPAAARPLEQRKERVARRVVLRVGRRKRGQEHALLLLEGRLGLAALQLVGLALGLGHLRLAARQFFRLLARHHLRLRLQPSLHLLALHLGLGLCGAACLVEDAAAFLLRHSPRLLLGARARFADHRVASGRGGGDQEKEQGKSKRGSGMAERRASRVRGEGGGRGGVRSRSCTRRGEGEGEEHKAEPIGAADTDGKARRRRRRRRRRAAPLTLLCISSSACSAAWRALSSAAACAASRRARASASAASAVVAAASCVRRRSWSASYSVRIRCALTKGGSPPPLRHRSASGV